MRTVRGGLLVLVAASVLSLHGQMASAENQPKVTVNKQVTAPAKPAPPVANPAMTKAGRGKISFSSKKKGVKSAGICSFDCTDGSGDTRITDDAGDCACQCADFCGGACLIDDLDSGDSYLCF